MHSSPVYRPVSPLSSPASPSPGASPSHHSHAHPHSPLASTTTPPTRPLSPALLPNNAYNPSYSPTHSHVSHHHPSYSFSSPPPSSPYSHGSSPTLTPSPESPLRRFIESPYDDVGASPHSSAPSTHSYSSISPPGVYGLMSSSSSYALPDVSTTSTSSSSSSPLFHRSSPFSHGDASMHLRTTRAPSPDISMTPPQEHSLNVTAKYDKKKGKKGPSTTTRLPLLCAIFVVFLILLLYFTRALPFSFTSLFSAFSNSRSSSLSFMSGPLPPVSLSGSLHAASAASLASGGGGVSAHDVNTLLHVNALSHMCAPAFSSSALSFTPRTWALILTRDDSPNDGLYTIMAHASEYVYLVLEAPLQALSCQAGTHRKTRIQDNNRPKWWEMKLSNVVYLCLHQQIALNTQTSHYVTSYLNSFIGSASAAATSSSADAPPPTISTAIIDSLIRNMGLVFALQHGASTIWELNENLELLPLHSAHASAAAAAAAAASGGTIAKDDEEGAVPSWRLHGDAPPDAPMSIRHADKQATRVRLQRWDELVIDGVGNEISSHALLAKRPVQQVLIPLSSQSFFNPFHHFGAPFAYPIGYPSFQSVAQSTIFSRHHGLQVNEGMAPCIIPPSNMSVAVQTFMIAREDEFYVKEGKRPERLNFNERAPSVVVGRGTFTSVRNQNTLFHRASAFSMVYPAHSDACAESVRGVLAQRLLWEAAQHIALMPPNLQAQSWDDDDDNIKQFNIMQQCKQLVENSQFYDSLINWSSTSSATEYYNDGSALPPMFQFMMSLWRNALKLRMIEERDIELLSAFLMDLKHMSYEAPTPVGLPVPVEPLGKGFDSCNGQLYTNCQLDHIRWDPIVLTGEGKNINSENINKFKPSNYENEAVDMALSFQSHALTSSLTISSKPFISFVLVGRMPSSITPPQIPSGMKSEVDIIQLQIEYIDRMAVKYDVDYELIVVDYHPYPSGSSLFSALSWPSRPSFLSRLRLIIVPPTRQMESMAETSEAWDFHEFRAKNIGMRRSRGEFIVALNVNSFLHADVWQHFRAGELRSNYIYRTQSQKLDIDSITSSVDSVVSWLSSSHRSIGSSHVHRVHPSDCSHSAHDYVQEGAADFTLIPRWLLWATHGYGEFHPSFSADAQFLCKLSAAAYPHTLTEYLLQGGVHMYPLPPNLSNSNFLPPSPHTAQCSHAFIFCPSLVDDTLIPSDYDVPPLSLIWVNSSVWGHGTHILPQINPLWHEKQHKN